MRARAGVQSVSYSKCGRKLARAEGNKVVVCDAETGFVESTLTVDSGEYGVLSVSFSPKHNVIAAGCYNGKIHLVDAVAGEVKSTLRGHSSDNPECTCQHFDEDGDEDYEADPQCPVTGHSNR